METVIVYCGIRTEFMCCVQISVILLRFKVLLRYVALVFYIDSSSLVEIYSLIIRSNATVCG